MNDTTNPILPTMMGWVDFNILGTYVGELTPIHIYTQDNI